MPTKSALCVRTFKHRGHQFVDTIVYGVDSNDFKYFEAGGLMVESNEKPKVIVGELGFDPKTKWGDPAKGGKLVLDAPDYKAPKPQVKTESKK